MTIQAIKCPGYYKRGDGRISPMHTGQERFFNPVIIQEVGEQIRVLCKDCFSGTCVSGVGKICESGVTGILDKDAKQIKCVFLEDNINNMS